MTSNISASVTPTASVSGLTNHQIRLASRPVGLPTRANWSAATEPVAEPAEGAVLLITRALSLDPAMRGWMNDVKSCIPPVGLGEVMRAGGVGKVMVPRNPMYAAGRHRPVDAVVSRHLLCFK